MSERRVFLLHSKSWNGEGGEEGKDEVVSLVCRPKLRTQMRLEI